MKTEKRGFSRGSFPRLLVLVPHRDVRLPLRSWSGELFAAGIPGAWSFPRVAPLAALTRALSADELKSMARALRERLRESGGVFRAGPPALAPLPFAPDGKPVFAFGPVLEPAGQDALFAFGPAPENSARDAFFGGRVSPVRRITPAVLGAALLHGPPPAGFPEPPRVSFRASALAVARFRPLYAGNRSGDGLSLEWEIGKLYWLPK